RSRSSRLPTTCCSNSWSARHVDAAVTTPDAFTTDSGTPGAHCDEPCRPACPERRAVHPQVLRLSGWRRRLVAVGARADRRARHVAAVLGSPRGGRAAGGGPACTA